MIETISVFSGSVREIRFNYRSYRQLVAACTLVLDGKLETAELRGLFVIAGNRRVGFGSALVRHVEREMRQRGLHRLFATSAGWDREDEIEAFFIACGFRVEVIDDWHEGVNYPRRVFVKDIEMGESEE